MARLILLPYEPGNEGGYQKAVQADMGRLNIGAQDVVMVYSDGTASSIPDALFIPRGKHRFLRRVTNITRFRTPAEILAREFCRALQDHSFDSIFCGDVVLYRAIREMYRQVPMTVRFHNFFSMARYRQGLRQYPIGLRLRYNLAAFLRLERQILQDPLATPIFITEEERQYAAMAFPGRRMDCWPVIPSIMEPRIEAQPPTIARLVYMGSLPTHTRAGVDYLVEHVFPAIAASTRNAQLHLFGGGTEAYHQPQCNVYGHGYFAGEGYPFNGDALFTVPDLLGGGVKIKVGDLLQAHVPFISTPFGAEGYQVPNDPNVLISDMDEWPNTITAYFRRLQGDSA